MEENLDVQYNRAQRSSTEIELEITIPKDQFKVAYEKAMASVSKAVSVKGFRKGHAPKDVVETKHGSEAVQKALEELMPKYAISAVYKEKLVPIANLDYEVKDISLDKDIVFKAIVPVLPEFEIPDIKDQKITRVDVEVKPEEVDAQINAMWEKYKGRATEKNDEWAKKTAGVMGLKAQTMFDFKKEIEEALKNYKLSTANKKFASDLLAAAIKKANFDIPEKLLKAETEDREKSFQDYLQKTKVTEAQFCQIRNITMDQMRDQWKLDAKAAIEDDIFLLSFAKKKNIQVTDEDLQKDIEAIKIANKKYIDEKPDDAKALFDNPRWRSYIKSVILKRMAYETFLRENGYYKVVGEPKPSSAEDAATVQLKEDNNATSTGKTDKKLIIPN